MSEPTKYDYDPGLFEPEPPEDAELTKALFCGRDQELERGTTTLRNHIDRTDRVKAGADKRPWIIHGESRSGKSHLARRILVDLQTDNQSLCLIVPARERSAAVQVMACVFGRLADAFSEHHSRDGFLNKWLQQGDIIAITDMVDRVKSFGSGIEHIDLKVASSEAVVAEIGARASLVPMLLKVLAKTGVKQTSENSHTYRLRRPTAEDYVHYCSVIINALFCTNEITHVLVLVDDVDLIEGYVDPTHNGRVERSVLANALVQLNQCPAVNVVVTSRSWYAHATKEFRNLVDLARSPEMTVAELVTIHDRRYQVRAVGQPAGFLTDEALRDAAADVRGLPGVFLQHLHTAFYDYQGESEWGLRSYDWYLAVFVRLFKQFCERHPKAAEEIVRAVESGSSTIDVSAKNLFHSTGFDNVFVFASYFDERVYYGDDLVKKVAAVSGEA